MTRASPLLPDTPTAAQPEPITGNAGSETHALPDEFRDYTQALDRLEQEKSQDALLLVLLGRERVAEWLKRNRLPDAMDLDTLAALDDRLRDLASHASMRRLPQWRQSYSPSSSSWWWFLDRSRDLPWYLLAAVLSLCTATLAVEITRRLWSGVSDTLAIFGTLVVLLLTTSPLIKQGQELAEWVMDRIAFLKQGKYARARAMSGTAALAFGLVLIVWLLLPAISHSMSNRAAHEYVAGDNQSGAAAVAYFVAAKHRLERAIALNPDNKDAYQTLAKVYRQLALPEEAATWYQAALNRDPYFAPAYEGLSRLYNEQGRFQLAEEIALAGIRIGCHDVGSLDSQPVEIGSGDAGTDVICLDLYANLGWAAYSQERYALAETAFRAAVVLEDLHHTAGVCKALPHYYLAQMHEQQRIAGDAGSEYRKAKRCLEPGSLADTEWLQVIQTKVD